MRRVVVTGLGLVSPLGLSPTQSWDYLISGKSGIAKIPERLFRCDDIPCRVAGIIPSPEEDPVRGLNTVDHIDRDVRGDRFIHLGLIAAQQAIKDSGWVPESDHEKERTSVLIGSGIGGLLSIEQHAAILNEQGPRRISPFFIPASLVNLLPGYVSMKNDFRGGNLAVVSACSTGSHAIGEAGRIITSGESDVVVCGGAEAAVCRLGLAGFAAARSLSTSFNDTPEAASRPWDRDRDGFVMAEGAGVVVLEELNHALSRGAKIYAELIGYGMSSDAYHITAPEPNGRGALQAMVHAVKRAGISPEQIGYINAHATSTPLGDKAEIHAVKRLFEGYSMSNTVMSATKSSMGHALGAAGSIEAIFTILAIINSLVPPTINLHNPEEDHGINLVPNEAISKKVDIGMSNSFGFGGTNTTLIFKRF